MNCSYWLLTVTDQLFLSSRALSRFSPQKEKLLELEKKLSNLFICTCWPSADRLDKLKKSCYKNS